MKNEHMMLAPSPPWIHLWNVQNFTVTHDIKNLNIRKQSLQTVFAIISQEA